MYLAATDLKKVIFNYGFILCIVVTFLLCFTSPVYTDSTGKEYIVFEVMIFTNQFEYIKFNGIDILKKSVNLYLTLFLPILSSLPFVTMFCTERNSNYIRFTIIRTGKMSYYSSKFFSAVLSGGISIVMGYALYGIIVCIYFSPCNISIIEILQLMSGMFLYGMVSTLPAFLVSSFIKNKYIICCTPFILLHFYYTMISQITSDLIQTNQTEKLMKISILYPSSVRNVFLNNENCMLIVVIYLVQAIFVYFVFIIIMERRIDYGE